ncbi:MAG: ABC transporter permease [Lachnospiraceae bacterium]|nr:ABC transporter permease [Lachnospiraceae bacterium]
MFGDLYPTQADRQIVAESMSNPVMVAMMGKAYGKDNYSLGALMSQQSLLFTIVAVAIMNILIVNRNLRGDEEAGRIELIRSKSTGRLFNVLATTIVCVGINILLSLLVGLSLTALNIESINFVGSMMFGIVLGISGIMFAAITACINQLLTNSKASLGFSFAILGISYFVRAIGDIGNENVAVLSPLGWIMRAQVYVENKIWPVILSIVISVVFILLAFLINSKRDLGIGLFHEKTGRDSGSVFLHGPLGLVVKILRVEYLAWIIAYIILGISFGAMLEEIRTQLESNGLMLQILACDSNSGELLYQFINVITSIFAMITTIPVITTIIKIREEEITNRIECLISKSITRRKLLSAFLICSIFISIVLQLIFAVSFWISGNQVIGDTPFELSDMLKAACAFIPAIWIIAGAAIAVIGLIPRITILVWAFLAYSFFVSYFGSMLNLDKWMMKLSPYVNVPNTFADGTDWIKLVVFILISAILTIVGYLGYGKRDLQA